MDRCTASKRGHTGQSSAAIAKCPVHGGPSGAAGSARVPRLTAPALGSALSDDECERLAADASTDAATVQALSEHDCTWVRHAVARRADLPAQTLARLARDDRWEVRAAAAGNPRSDEAMVLELATDPVEAVRCVVANRPDATVQVLALLAQDDEESVPLSVADHPHATPEIIDAIARGTHRAAGIKAITDSRLPSRALGQIANGDGPLCFAARQASAQRIRARFALDIADEDATQVLLSMPWWELDKDDDEVRLVLTLYPQSSSS